MKIALLAFSAFAALSITAGPAAADGMLVDAGGDTFHVTVTSYKQLRFRSVIRQEYDFSCGSAALASLLTYQYNRPHTEEDVFQAMWRVGDQANIRKFGFSLLDMKTYLESIGMQADGYQVTLDKIAELQVPGITLIEINGYKHFVVIKGITKDRILIGDPARGLRSMKRADFALIWSGIVLFIRTDVATAQKNFNPGKDWAAQGRAPIGTANAGLESIGAFTLNLRPQGSF